jgi:hypothetical protein
MSFNDVIGALEDPTGDMISKIAPPIKSLIEQISNKDFFLDEGLTPSETRTGVKRVFPDTGTFIGQKLGAPIVSDDGRMLTTSDVTTRLLNLRRNLLPLPLLDSLVSGADAVKAGKRTKGEEIAGRITPFKVRKLKAEQMKRERQRTLRKLKKMGGEVPITGEEPKVRGRRQRRKRTRKRRR